MTKLRLVFAKGEKIGPVDPLDDLLRAMNEAERHYGIHPLYALHATKLCRQPDELKQRACRHYLNHIPEKSLERYEVSELRIVMGEFPQGPLAKTLQEDGVNFEEWLLVHRQTSDIINFKRTPHFRLLTPEY